MGNTNTPYIAKAAGNLINPVTATLFTQAISPIATVAATQVLKVAYATYHGYSQAGAGVSNNINLVPITVRAAGRCSYGVAGSFTPALVLAASGTSSNFLPTTTVVPLGAATAQAASGVGFGIWEVDATIYWDPNTGVIIGSYKGVQSAYVGGVATQTFTGLTGITPITGFTAAAPPTTQASANLTPAATGELTLLFAVTGLFSVSNPNNVATQDLLETEEI